jgi:hypothetical protein
VLVTLARDCVVALAVVATLRLIVSLAVVDELELIATEARSVGGVVPLVHFNFSSHFIDPFLVRLSYFLYTISLAGGTDIIAITIRTCRTI